MQILENRCTIYHPTEEVEDDGSSCSSGAGWDRIVLTLVPLFHTQELIDSTEHLEDATL